MQFHICNHCFKLIVLLQLICGLATFASSFWSNKAGLFTFAVLFGLFNNSYAYSKAATAKLLERRCFADAFSWILMFEGIGVLAGPFLAGTMQWFTDITATQHYRYSNKIAV